MTNPIDTSPARLKWFAEISREWMPELCDALLAVAAEKEAQAKQEPVAWLRTWEDNGRVLQAVYLASECPEGITRNLSPGISMKPLYLAPQPSEQVVSPPQPKSYKYRDVTWVGGDGPPPTEDETPPQVSEPAPMDVPLPEPLAEIWDYDDRGSRKCTAIFSSLALHQYAEAYANAKVAAERERLCAELKIAMQHSAWDDVLQLDDALRNIDDMKGTV